MISIVIPHINEPQLLLQCMLAIHRELVRDEIQDYEFIIVDNSDEGQGPDMMLARVFSNEKIRVLYKVENQAMARLTGLMEAKGEFVLILDSHTIVDKGIFSKSLKLMQKRPEVYLIHYPNINNGGGKFEYLYGNTWLVQGNIRIAESWPELDYPYPITCQYSLCMFMRKKILDFLSPDVEREYYGYSMEEPNLGYRVWCMGKQVWIIPTIVNIHNSGRKQQGNMPLEEQRLTTAYVLGGEIFYENWYREWINQGSLRSGWMLDKDKVKGDREFILKNAKYTIQELPEVWRKVGEEYSA